LPPTSPLNKTYNVRVQNLNINSNGDNIWYNWNGTNYTYTTPVNINFTEGSITLNAWANDSSGDVNTTSVVFGVNTSITSDWDSIIPPEGIFEPYNALLSGTHVNNFSIIFTNLTIKPTEMLSCNIKVANGSIKTINETGLSLANVNYSLNYTIQQTDSIINDGNVGYVPWILKNCTLTGSSLIHNETKVSRIYVHDDVYWDEDEITRAVACAGSPGKYFNNTAKCEYQEDTKFALQMYAGSPTNETCMNNPGVANESEYCRGIFFPTNDPLDYFGGYSALTDDP
ncbi:unnamed protein product, partial [marine sediment metagenome]